MSLEENRSSGNPADAVPRIMALPAPAAAPGIRLWWCSLDTPPAGELGVEPGKVEIVRGIRGRPQLSGTPPLDFNISHTGDVAIVGVLQGARIGVDVERIDRVVNVAGIARKFLTANERRELGAADTDAARTRLLTLWTCKEAMSKATGDGISAPFDEIGIDRPDRLVVVEGSGPYAPARWTLHAVDVADELLATVAIWSF